MKKIIFPLFNSEKHNFLVKKWWFRAIIVIYLIALVISPFMLFASYTETAKKCYFEETSNLKPTGFENFKCVYPTQTESAGFFVSVLIGIIVLHYLIQIFFFSVVVGYIVLGNKKL